MNETTKTVIKAAAVLIVFGFSFAGVALDTEEVVTGLSGVVAFATMCVTIWENFNFTKAAQEGQKLTDRLKFEARARNLKVADDGETETEAEDEDVRDDA